ncbi:MAG: OmpA family protein [Alphaproteobacteria bacterium]|nr:OmpA family protein [Alphaproteobacteria bacterium]
MAQGRRDDNSHYISLSDIMTALMLVFLFIAVSFMIDITNRHKIDDQCQKMTAEYHDKKEQLYGNLKREFRNDLKEWNAEITPDLVMRFHDDAVQFESDQAILQDEFKEKLAEFFPRFLKQVKKFENNVQEIRIEGHTDTSGPCDVRQEYGCVMRDGPYSIEGDFTNSEKNYLYNMALSQARAKSVLAYCLTQVDDFEYMKQNITANGLSYSKLITDKNGRENKAASRRVEFRVLLKTNIEEIGKNKK